LFGAPLTKPKRSQHRPVSPVSAANPSQTLPVMSSESVISSAPITAACTPDTSVPAPACSLCIHTEWPDKTELFKLLSTLHSLTVPVFSAVNLQFSDH